LNKGKYKLQKTENLALNVPKAYFTFLKHKKGGRGEGDGEGASDRGGEPAVYAGGAGRGLEGGALPIPGIIVLDDFCDPKPCYILWFYLTNT
jgi:hypothetical protein